MWGIDSTFLSRAIDAGIFEPYEAEGLDEIKTALKASVGRDVQLAARVDPSILGGLIVKVGSRMVDNSLRTKLQNLKISMKGVG